MRVLWVFLPVLGAPLLHAPVLALDLMEPLRRPLDGGRNVFGANKTWRGALFMTAGVLFATVLLAQWPWWWHELPHELRDAGPWLYGLLLGLGVVLGELPNSFLKRRLGMKPGTQRAGLTGALLTLYDQGDFVLGVWVLLLPVWGMAWWQALLAFAVISVVHVALNLVGYAIGARSSRL